MGVACLALSAHRSHPRTVAVVNAVCIVVVTALEYVLTPLLLAPVMTAMYWLTTHTGLRTARLYSVTTAAALMAASAVFDPTYASSPVPRSIGYCFWLLLPLGAGSMTRLRRAYVASVQARAEHAERTREEEARLRVTEERMRIARELHDVVAHHLALANAQAGTAAHFALTDPRRTKKILTGLTDTTSSALRELKSTLGLLRHNGGPDSASLEPSPSLARLPELVSTCASAGLTVTVTTTGEPRPLTSGVDLTAFRIVQEALTNATKHAAADTAHVRLAYEDSRLLITVTNDEPPGATDVAASAPGQGFGIMGMRERAHTVGGEFRAGPRPGGGFEVAAGLPLPLAAAEAAPEATDDPTGEQP
ncbi:sensor histidine kinase [Actinomadura madurae]|uniref:sensor histidine kinase n=1 Tax=Actinomadura madurae TaxID=1993 RepID=UPI0020260AB3|nr:sensor histidine kinase [Actinomadura madurae]MCP9949112.1 sensor histidine kinase [Actinomadura madurae]MCP9965875.1 sensor histidine kinase [Actinomadura madurae]MCP9978353.1 sensor histidine kinase [Actinomadura madurae]MCQ0010125.1 sensor histidine kinase [Actinomadura madurae]MCQ0014560.1 sensor histidine kinase [Actinomadura madurae]